MADEFDRVDFISDMYDETLRDLRQRVADGTASPQDRKLIIQIAEKHGVDVDVTQPGNPLTGTDENFDLPFTMDDLTVDAEVD